MKKSILLAGIILCLAACHSESADLRLLDLTGNVESVTMFTTEYVDSLGNKTKGSFRYQDTKFIFDENGRITAGYDMDYKLQIGRNRLGYIEYIILPCEVVDMNGFLIEWNDGGYDMSYKWNLAGYLKSIGETTSIGAEREHEILYGRQHKRIGEKTVCEINACEGCNDMIRVENIVQYKILESDSYGNWTKRVEKSEYTEFDENNNAIGPTKTSYKLSERTITYYEKSH